MLPQEDELSIEKPRRRYTPAIGQRGRRAGARAAGARGAAPAAAPGSSSRCSGGGGGSREPARPWAVRGGGEGSLPAAAPCPARLAEGARLQNPRLVGCGARGWEEGRSRGSFPELLAALKKPSSFHAGSLGMPRQHISARARLCKRFRARCRSCDAKGFHWRWAQPIAVTAVVTALVAAALSGGRAPGVPSAPGAAAEPPPALLPRARAACVVLRRWHKHTTKKSHELLEASPARTPSSPARTLGTK